MKISRPEIVEKLALIKNNTTTEYWNTFLKYQSNNLKVLKAILTISKITQSYVREFREVF